MRLLVFLCAVSAFAASPFDGTWKVDLSTVQFPQKPEKIEINNGVYTCFTCTPELKVKADGTDQSVDATGRTYDAINVRIVDAQNIEITTKKDGKVVGSQKITVDKSGNRLTRQVTQYPMNSKEPITATVFQNRVEKGPQGSHLGSGSWRTEKENQSANAVTMTIKTMADGITLTGGTGETYTAKFDGKDYPVQGVRANDTVSLKRINANAIEETDKRNGQVTEKNLMTVSQDGRSMLVVSEETQKGTTVKFTALKQ